MCFHVPIHRALTRGVAFTVLAAAALGCGRHPGGGRIEVTYRQVDPEKSKDPHNYAGSVSTAWCPGAGRLEVTSINNDMGFGLVIYPVDTLVAGAYRAFDPGIDSASRPGAAGVARWFTEQRVTGLQSDSGMLKLTRSGDAFDATFGFRLRAIDGSDTTRVTGRATGLRPGPCVLDSLPGTAPKQ